ncbi:outer membrane beta-barrel protein [Photobacterium carnosum]|uniref:outer membrane beta-barrel protein n=1 Tax=Photobacterium carnosum TaxID=2023717 RepID=UPI001E2C2088|nr:outer membrane beta-barrel protein [Photobacterium carnosum]MCD9514746.1 outer membrane beta-barrel protein [Photobacterium carnosum]
MIKKTLIISAFTSLLLSTTAKAAEPFLLQPVSDNNTATPLVKFDDSTHYFVGLTGGSSDISMTAGTVNGNNTTLINQFSSPDVAGFVGADLGFYTAGGSGRIYYSWQKMSTQSDFDGVKAIETDVTLHLLNADYIFRADKTINPFIGAHLGYMTADIKGQGYGSHSQSGQVLGIQLGVAWRISDHISAEMGLRHTATQGEDIKPWSSNKVASQIKSVSTGYASVNYRF